MQDAECDHSRAAVLTDMQREWTNNEFSQCVEYKIVLVCHLVLCMFYFFNSTTLPNFPKQLFNVGC